MVGCRFFTWNSHEMNQMPIIFIAFFIASAYIPDILVVANEQQQAEQSEFNQKYAVIGNNFTISCETETSTPIKWNKDGVNITESNERFHLRTDNNDLPISKYSLTIQKVEENDTGNYTCEQFGTVDGDVKPVKKQFTVSAVIPPRIVEKSPDRIETRISKSVLLFCVIEVHPLADFEKYIKWEASNGNHKSELIANRTNISHVNGQRVNITLDLANIAKKDDGDYLCVVEIPYDNDIDHVFGNSSKITAKSSVVVLDVPQVSFDFVQAVGASKIFLNWTVNNGNSPITTYFIQYSKKGDLTYEYYKDLINGSRTSCVLENFQPNTTYYLKIQAKNEIGPSKVYDLEKPVTTLAEDPVFVPVNEVKGMTTDTITIGWSPPNSTLLKYIQYYELTVAEGANESKIIEEAVHQQNSRNLPYMFDKLKSGTKYVFRTRACNELTKLCGNWSASVTGETSDGIASPPNKLVVECKLYPNDKKTAQISVKWEVPSQSNGVILNYTLEVTGIATYRSENKRDMRNETYGPKTILATNLTAEIIRLPLNTNYTVKVSANTRSKKPGSPAIGKCSTPLAIPEWKPIYWEPIHSGDAYLIKLDMPKLSERNGPICGYRIFVIRLPETSGFESHGLPPISRINISTYQEVHAPSNKHGGVYLAESISADTIERYIILGDGNKNLDDGFQGIQNSECRRLLKGHWPANRITSPAHSLGDLTSDYSSRSDHDDLFKIFGERTPGRHRDKNLGGLHNINLNYHDRHHDRYHNNHDVARIHPRVDDEDSNELSRRLRPKHFVRREANSNEIASENTGTSKGTTTTPKAAESIQTERGSDNVFDGLLNPDSIYSGFIEVIVNKNDKEVMTDFSRYIDFVNMRKAVDPAVSEIIYKIFTE